MKTFVLTVAITVGLLGCVTQLSNEASQVRTMTAVDKPSCKYVSDVEAWGRTFTQEFGSIDTSVDDSFNDALNAVASVGGDAYVIIGTNKTRAYFMQAWNCGWDNNQSADLAISATPPKQISAAERQRCRFIKTIAEGSNWGISKKRNLRNAKEGAIKLVQEVGGDSYYVVEERLGSIVIVIIEAWRCND